MKPMARRPKAGFNFSLFETFWDGGILLTLSFIEMSQLGSSVLHTPQYTPSSFSFCSSQANLDPDESIPTAVNSPPWTGAAFSMSWISPSTDAGPFPHGAQLLVSSHEEKARRVRARIPGAVSSSAI